MGNFIQTSFGKVNSHFPIVDFSKYVYFQEGPGLRKWQWTDYGMKVINVTNIIGDGSIDILNTDRYIAESEFESKYAHFAIESGDILIASSGNTYGKVGRIRNDQLPVMMNTSVIRMHPHDKQILSFNYLYAYVRSPLFQNQIEQFVIGSAQPNFGPAHLKRMKLIFPLFSVQQKIATVLSAYDELMENNTRRIRILEEMAQAIYREWFVNFRFPGHEGARMVESELGPVPEGWEVQKISEVCQKIYSGGTPNTKIPEYWDGGIPWLSSGETRNRYIISTDKTISSDGVSNSSTRFVNAGTTVMASAGQGQTRGQTSFLAIDSYINQSIIALIANAEKISDLYLFFNLSGRYPELRQISDSNASRGSLTTKSFAEMNIVIPPKSLMDQFTKHVLNHANLILTITHQNANLRRTRDLLLPKLISGEIDVSDLDIQIPEAEA